MEILHKNLNQRLKRLTSIICFLITAIIGYLYHLQVIQSRQFALLSKKNFLRTEKIPSARGNIVDCAGNLLATNKPVTTISWRGSGSKEISADTLAVLDQISSILEVTPEERELLLIAEKKGQQTIVKDEVSFMQLSKLLEQFPDHKNIIVQHKFKRFYPHKSIAAHVIGYLGCMDMEASGRMGLELLFDDTLKGQPGELVKTINSVGKHLAEQELQKALAGGTITTTLDIDLQFIAEEIFPENESGTCLIFDPLDGAIKGLVSRPSFDPNLFLASFSTDQWQDLNQKKCFINRALNACYPPASLFKLVTMCAALEQHIVTPDSSWCCFGHITFGGRPYFCSKKDGHGIINAQLGLAHSCNIPFFDIAKKIKIDTLADYARRFGLGQKTTIIFPEKVGLIPTSAWKRQAKGEPWWPGETLSACIGQSFLLVTPMQIAVMISAIMTGYLVRPRILMHETVVKQPVPVSRETLKFLKKSMKQTIQEGSARSLKRFHNIDIYAKTGTAQTSDLSKRTLGKKYEEHGWFVSFVRYKHHPALLFVIVIENIGSSSVATAACRAFLRRYMSLMDDRAKKAALEVHEVSISDESDLFPLLPPLEATDEQDPVEVIVPPTQA